MGEEYVRRIMVLGSVPSLGPVILFDDIEDLLKWDKSGTGTDYVVVKSTTVAYNGLASLQVKTRTTGAAAGDLVTAKRTCFERPGRRYRFECLFRITAYQNCVYTKFRLFGDDMTNQFIVEVAFARATRQWFYMDSTGAYVLIPGSDQYLVDGAWHRVLFEVDTRSGLYLRFESDQFSYDFSNVAIYKANTADSMFLRTELELHAYATTPPEVHFDDVLVMEI